MRARAFIVAAILLGLTVGACFGMGAYTFIYARGGSYMTDDPAACANCHVMSGEYWGWMRSSHRKVAVCNDCHTPKGFVAKYLTKADNGWHHSLAFTTGDFHEPIRIKSHNLEIAEKSCRKCHADVIAAMDGPHGQKDKSSCLRCHQGVGHP